MDALARYLERGVEPLYEKLPRPADRLRLVVVIPALAESEYIGRVLDSLGEPDDEFEILVVVNRPQGAPAAVRDDNERLRRQLARRPVLVIERVYPDARAGVGAARRTGMDLALRRLVAAGQPEHAAIACLDADSPVSPGYARQLLALFAAPAAPAAVVCRCCHPLPAADPERARAMATYELWLRYLCAGAAVAGSPYVHLPIGSCLVVGARAYAAAQGMPRRQAAEDFYFLQKLVKTVGPKRVRSVLEPVVYPAPRLSNRVPFGTGRALWRCREQGPDTYRLVEPAQAFLELREFFAAAAGSLRQPERLWQAAGPMLREFLEDYRFGVVLERLSANSSSGAGFLWQLHCWFDARRLVRFVRRYRSRQGAQDLLAALEQLGLGRHADIRSALEHLRAEPPPPPRYRHPAQ